MIIAFWLPGFILFWGLTYSHAKLADWLPKSDSVDAPLVGRFFYASLASLALGLLINAARGVIVDNLFYFVTCLKRAEINNVHLKNEETLAAFQAAVENHYRYYQYYANSLVAIFGATVAYVFSKKEFPPTLNFILIIAILVILAWAARKELDAFNQRATDITR